MSFLLFFFSKWGKKMNKKKNENTRGNIIVSFIQITASQHFIIIIIIKQKHLTFT